MLVNTYTEDGYESIPSVRLPDEEYARGLQCFVPVCADIVPVDRGRRLIYLARRSAKPMRGWWWLGGRMQPHETKEEAALRNLRKETGLDLRGGVSRLDLVAVLDYRFKDRAQDPPMGCHVLAFTFAVELSAEELSAAAANLVSSEYESAAGLSAFDRERLVSERVFPSILDFYDQLFR